MFTAEEQAVIDRWLQSEETEQWLATFVHERHGHNIDADEEIAAILAALHSQAASQPDALIAIANSSPASESSASQPAEPVEYGFCGALGWTVKQWGRVTHKHSCPNRTDPFCQTHPQGCPAEPVE